MIFALWLTLSIVLDACGAAVASRRNVVRKADLRRVIDTFQERGVSFSSLDILPSGEVRLTLGAPGQSAPGDFSDEVRSWDEALS